MRNILRFMRRSRSSKAGLKVLTALICALLLGVQPLTACAEVADDFLEALDDFEAQAALDEAASINMSYGDITMGYVAQAGAWLNPLMCTERDLVSLNQLVFESVVELDENMQPVPLLADSWTLEEKTWTFKLRSGITFHSGEEMVAMDVLESYNMFVQTSDDNPYRLRLKLINSMEVVDAFTLKVEAKYPGLITLYAMTFPVMQRNTLTDNLPRGTGPYWYINYIQDGAVRLESNPLWWKQQPEIKSVLAMRFEDTGDALEALQTGVIDTLATRSASAAISRRLSDLTYMDYSTCTYEVLVPNLSQESPLSDKRVRQAVMYAIDRTTLASNAYLDMAQQSEVPVVPGSWIYESQSAVYNYSPERALQLLHEAGWSNVTDEVMLSRIIADNMLEDLKIEIYTYNESRSSVRSNAAEQIAANLRTIGVDATVTVTSRSNVTKAIKEGTCDLALVSINLSEVPNLAPMFSEGGAVNLSGYVNDTMNALLAATMTAATEESFKKAFSDLQLFIADELPMMGLVFRTGTLLSTRQMGGLEGIREGHTLRGLEFVSGE